MPAPCQHQIVEQLGPVIGMNRLGSFQFEDGPLIYDQIQKIGFAEFFVADLDRKLNRSSGELTCDCRLIDSLVKEASKLLVDAKHGFHDGVRNRPKLLLIQ